MCGEHVRAERRGAERAGEEKEGSRTASAIANENPPSGSGGKKYVPSRNDTKSRKFKQMCAFPTELGGNHLQVVHAIKTT